MFRSPSCCNSQLQFTGLNQAVLIAPRFLARESYIFLAPTLALGFKEHPVQGVPGPVPSRVKRPRREAYHLTLSSAEVKNELGYTSFPT